MALDETNQEGHVMITLYRTVSLLTQLTSEIKAVQVVGGDSESSRLHLAGETGSVPRIGKQYKYHDSYEAAWEYLNNQYMAEKASLELGMIRNKTIGITLLNTQKEGEG